MMHTETPHTLCGIYIYVYIYIYICIYVQEKRVRCTGFASLAIARPSDLANR